MIEYIKPTLNVSLYRTAPTTGEVKMELSGNYFNGSFGAVSNVLQLRYRFKEGNGDFGAWNDITGFNVSENKYTYDAVITGFTYTNNYTFEIQLLDKIYDGSAAELSLIKTESVMKGIPIFDWGEHDFNFNVPIFYKGVEVPMIIEQGNSGIWSYRIWSDGSAECWGRKQCDSVYCANAWGSVFESTTSYSEQYPFVFKEKPCQILSVSGTSNYAVWLEYPTDTASNTEAYTGNWYFVRPTSMLLNTVYVDIYVKGELPSAVLKNESFDGRNVFQFSGSYPEFTYGGSYAIDYYHGTYGYLVKNAVVRDMNLVSAPWLTQVTQGLQVIFANPDTGLNASLTITNEPSVGLQAGVGWLSDGVNVTYIGTENDKLTIYRLS